MATTQLETVEITALPKRTSSQLTQSDFVMGVASNAEGYGLAIKELGDYIIQYVASEINGKSQTLRTAIESVDFKDMSYHYCSTGEYDATTGVPTIADPDPETFYLAPSVSSNSDFNAYYYKDNEWVLFTTVELDLTTIPTDKTLTQSDVAADAKVVGDEITNLKDDLDKLNDGGLIIKDNVIEEDINNWLDTHPEASTTVQDGSLTEAKFSNALKLKTIKDYVTPQMYGAKGDGVTDDTVAFIEALFNAAVVLVPSGTYVISSQIEITNKHRLIANGTVRIYTSVLNDYAFYIHGNEGDDYQSTNNYYDTYKGVWFGGTCGGITIINNNGTNGILFGTINYPSDGTIGANSIAQIANVGIQGYDVGLKITNYNNYLNVFNRVHFERCGDCVVFGDLDTTKKNSGEMFKFIDCIFSTSNTAVKYISQGWESSFIGCSIDFCIVGFYDSDYNRIFFSNGHIEGVGKKTLSDTVYGILVNQHEHTYISLDNVAFDISNSRGTKLFYGTGNIHLGASFILTAEKYPSTVADVFLSDHYITKTAVCFGQSLWRMYLSKDNNLVPDALLSTATIGTLGGNDITDQIKIYYKTGCTAEIVSGSMFSNQKAIRFNGNGNAPMTATVKVTIPVQPTKTYNAGFATYKHSDQSMTRNLRASFYDKNGNKLSETTAYLYSPDQAPKDAIFFPFISKQATAPAGSVYAEFAYIVSVSPDASALAVGEYIDIQYMYCEEW